MGEVNDILILILKRGRALPWQLLLVSYNSHKKPAAAPNEQPDTRKKAMMLPAM